MNNELLLLLRKHTDKLIEQTKTKPQETLEFVLDKQMQSLLFSLPMDSSEEGKWLLAVISFEETNSLFTITDENNSFSISMPGRCRTPNYSKDNIIDELKNLLKFKSEKDIGLHMEEVRKIGNKLKVGDEE